MCHYSALCVEKTATPHEIKKAFHNLALKHHPDKGGCDESFARIRASYEVLSDPTRRKVYDISLMARIFSSLSGDIFSDMLSDSIRRTMTPKRPPPAQQPPAARQPKRTSSTRVPISHSVTLSLEECYSGKTCKFAISRRVACSACGGDGGFDRTERDCLGCLGTGFRTVHRGPTSARSADCIKCHGRKKRTVYSKQCGACKGQTVVRERAVFVTAFPPGVGSGEKNRLCGEGDSFGEGGGRGRAGKGL